MIICEIVINKNCPWDFKLEEGGFFVFSKTDVGLRLEHEYYTFNDFIKIFYKR